MTLRFVIPLAALTFAFAGLLVAGEAEPPPATLRQHHGLAAPVSLDPAHTALLLIDWQEELVSGGLPLSGVREAAGRAHALLAWARGAGVHVVHVQQRAPAGAPLFAEGSRGAEPIAGLEAAHGELVIGKRMAGGFTGTPLHGELAARGVDTLVVAGLPTHLAVDSTVRDALVLGYRVIVAADATATRALPAPGGGYVSAASLQTAALAALADRFADVWPSATIMALPRADRPARPAPAPRAQTGRASSPRAAR